MKIEMDFVEDVRRTYAGELQQWGYQLPTPTGNASEDAHRIFVDWWNARARRIEARPRTVHWSPELRAREPNLPTPIRAGLAVIEQEIATGIDLTARLSRQLPRRGFNDQLLNDWGIQHLHLDATNRAQGTREIAFVLVRPDHAYLLDVQPHGHGTNPWVDDDLVEIIHLNWPHEIARFRLDNMRMHPMTREQRRNLRSKNANAAVAMDDGTVYAGIGGGIVGSGANIRAITSADYVLGTACDVEAWIRANTELVTGTIECERPNHPDVVRLGLAELAPDHAKVLVENVDPPFWFPVAIEQAPKVTIDLRRSPQRVEAEA